MNTKAEIRFNVGQSHWLPDYVKDRINEKVRNLLLLLDRSLSLVDSFLFALTLAALTRVTVP